MTQDMTGPSGKFGAARDSESESPFPRPRRGPLQCRPPGACLASSTDDRRSLNLGPLGPMWPVSTLAGRRAVRRCRRRRGGRGRCSFPAATAIPARVWPGSRSLESRWLVGRAGPAGVSASRPRPVTVPAAVARRTTPTTAKPLPLSRRICCAAPQPPPADATFLVAFFVGLLFLKTKIRQK
jgi:hypothetical protein